MSEKEMSKLNAWIAEYVIGHIRADSASAKPKTFAVHGTTVLVRHALGRCLRIFQPTTESSDAMDVLKKCAENTWNVFIRKDDQMYTVGYIGADNASDLALSAEASTLELAICLFARKLFDYQNPHNESPTCHCDSTPKTNHP